MKLIRSLTILFSQSHCEARFNEPKQFRAKTAYFLDCRAPATLRLAVARNDKNKITGGKMLTQEFVLKVVGWAIIITVAGVWAWVERKTRDE